jgi:hypothetical protein
VQKFVLISYAAVEIQNANLQTKLQEEEEEEDDDDEKQLIFFIFLGYGT